MPEIDLSKYVMRVERLDTPGVPRGTAFLISLSGKGYALTCYHVVQNQEYVRLCNDQTWNFITARVLPQYTSQVLDLALLQLERHAPVDLELLPLSVEPPDDQRFKTFGFGGVQHEIQGIWIQGEVVGVVNHQNRKMLQLRSHDVSEGTSGSPVVLIKPQVIVGMITEFNRTTQNVHNDLALALPADEILKALSNARLVYPILMLGRETELHRVEKLINNVENRSDPVCVLSFYSLDVGVGRSKLLQKVWEIYERKLPTVSLDIKAYIDEHGRLEKGKLLCNMAEQIDERLPQRLSITPLPSDRLEDCGWLAEQLVSLVSLANSYDKCVLLLIDNCEALPKADQEWFENEIVAPLIRYARVATVLTSEGKFEFTRADLKMRHEQVHLASIPEQALSDLYPGFAQITEELYEISGGLPYILIPIGKILHETSIKTSNEFKQQEARLVREAYASAEEYYFKEMDAAQKETILVLCLLRRFNPNTLAYLLPIVLSQHYKSPNINDYLNLIDEYDKKIQWVKEVDGYVISKAVGKVLKKYMWIERPNVVMEIDQTLIKFYTDQIACGDDQRYQRYQVNNILDLLYHRLHLEGFNLGEFNARVPDGRLQKSLTDHLRDLFERGMIPLDINMLISLSHAIRQDEDLGSFVTDETVSIINSYMAMSNK